MNKKQAVNLSLRYAILIVFGFFHKEIFYSLFLPLTFYPTIGFLNLVYGNVVHLPGEVIFFGAGVYVQIIEACVAGAAYYLLLILNLTTPMKTPKRVKSLIFLFVAFLVLNITRIIVFSLLAVNGGNYFDTAHMLMWYFGSTAMVVCLWFFNVWMFRINDVPIYTDLKELSKDISKK